MGAFWGNREHRAAGGAGRRPADRADREGGEHGPDAQEELQAVLAASEADRELAGAAEDLGAQEVSGDAGAS